MIAGVLGVLEAGHVRTTERLGVFRTRCGGWALLRVTDSRSGGAVGRSDTAASRQNENCRQAPGPD
jgi:hypothetical protein